MHPQSSTCPRCAELEILLAAALAKLAKRHGVSRLTGPRAQTVEPFVLCACGCEQPTQLASQTRKGRGQVQGEPLKYIDGHQGRLNPAVAGPDYLIDEYGCWIWQRARNPDGYGEKSGISAHRFYYQKYHGPIPKGMEVDHVEARGCKSRACVNPAHLELVTRLENIRRGKVAKLTMQKADEIRTLLADKTLTHAIIGVRYGVSAATISAIARGKTWRPGIESAPPATGALMLPHPSNRETGDSFRGLVGTL